MRAEPSNIIPSKGNLIAYFKKTISPGTTSTDEICMTVFYLRTWRGIS